MEQVKNVQKLTINQIINGNADFVAHVTRDGSDMARKLACASGMSFVEFRKRYRENLYRLLIVNTWVKASKKMRRDLSLIGVGRYVKNEVSK